MTDWAELSDIYGSAAEISALLRDATVATDWDAQVWDDLWSRLCHQGATAQASYAALPALTLMAEARHDLAVDPALFLAASIVAATDGPSEIVNVRDRYATQIASLRFVAEHKLSLVQRRADFIYALQTLAAFEDLSVWQRQLEGLANEEVELECPRCAKHLYLELRRDTLTVTAEPDSVVESWSVQQAEPSSVGRAEARLLELCRKHDQDDLVMVLLQLFGTARCPNCGNRLIVADALA